MNCHIIFSHYGRTNIFYPKDAVIFEEGSLISGIHYLQSGHIKLMRTDDDGNQVLIKEIFEGEMFGHRCFFNKRVYGFSALPTEDVLVSFLDRPMMYRLITEDPEISHTLLKILGEELEEADNRNYELARLR